MYKYDWYKAARDAAWRALIDFEIKELPISPLNILHNIGANVISYTDGRHIIKGFGLDLNYMSDDGFSINIGDHWLVFYNEKVRPIERIRFTLAHELGHILLNHELTPQHTTFGETFYTDCGTSKPQIEYEADIFASRLLAPAVVLHQLGVTTADEIQNLCCISKQAAEHRASRMRELNQRDKYKTSPLERVVLNNFEEFIRNKKL